VNALQPGDTLTIGPGEYFENVTLSDFGDLNKETLIRAELPGTVVLRGDRDAGLDFAQVPGRRFVYVADCETEVLSVHEADTLTNLAPAADAVALEFGPGRFFYDAQAAKLYVSSSDFQPPERHHSTLGVLRGNGFHLLKCRRVVLDGLAASGYRTAVEKEVLLLPTSGFLLHQTQQCVVRRCTAFFNASGITLNSGVGSNTNQPGEGGRNLVEDCRAYANRLDGIVAYNPDGETIRNCQSFLNQTYGARFYGGRASEAMCLMEEVIAWGNPGGDFWAKGSGLSGYFEQVVAERCIAFRDCQFGNFQHGIIGGRNVREGERPTTILLPDGHQEFHEFLDTHFADPLNFDFRLQAASSFSQPRQDGTYAGPYPYQPNIYYVKTDGNDGLDGLSMTAAWKTPARAVGQLRPGDTLYVAPGRYAGDLAVATRGVSIRGRGVEPVVIAGGLRIVDGQAVSFERLEISGPVIATKGQDIEFSNCVFSGPSVRAEQLEGLRMTHNLFTVPLDLQACSQATLSGNLYAAAPAVTTDSLESVRYSSYNSYADAAQCWRVGGKVVSWADLRPRHDAHSTVEAPELGKANNATIVANEFRFSGRGPLSTAIGPYRAWKPVQLKLMGPFVHSRSGTSADVEWWSTLPVQVDLRWGDVPEYVNKTPISQNAFYSYSLVGLEAGKKYSVKVTPKSISPSADPARRFRLPEAETAPVEFVLEPRQAHPATYHVAPDGDDARDGLSRTTAWHSLQTAADRVRPGDTVLLAGGTYPGTFYFRATGEPGRPITFRAMPGEKATIDGMGETLKVGFVLYGKHHYRLDSLYFNGYAGIEDNVAGAEGGAIFARDCADLQVTRCHFSGGWGRCFVAHDCAGLHARNCVFMHSMEATMFHHCPDLLVENSVFISPLITHLHVYNNATEPASVRRCIFGENTRAKVHICFVHLASGTVEADNCFYTRWPETERLVINNLTLPEYRADVGDTGSLVANPHLPGALGFRQGWQQVQNKDFDGLFATNPEVVLRGIGLQPEAFRDFHFWKEDWPYDEEWAASVQSRMNAAQAFCDAGEAAKAVAAYADLAENARLSERLRTQVLDRAAECAAGGKDYQRALELAKRIPLPPFSIRRQMAILVEQRRFGELIEWFADRPGQGALHLSWLCPETEMVMADALYYRGIAYAETGDLEAAETDMRTMVDKETRLNYSPGPTILDLSRKRLGDFCRTFLEDEARKLQADLLKTQAETQKRKQGNP